MVSLNELTRKTKTVNKKFSNVDKWTIEVRALDLVEEVGELCNAIIVTEGYKHEKRRRANLADSLCDILYNLILISVHYKVSLPNEYLKMLKNLETRIENKDFDND